MDAIVIIGIALVLTVKNVFFSKQEVSSVAFEKEDVTRTTKLNDSFYEDPNAFYVVANMLGYPK